MPPHHKKFESEVRRLAEASGLDAADIGLILARIADDYTMIGETLDANA
jgi:hypothetical protein